MLPLLIILLLLLKGSASEPILELNVSHTIEIGRLISVTCFAKFSLHDVTRNATISISKDGTLLKSAAVNFTTGGSVNYQQQDAQFSDSGEYSCEFKDDKSFKTSGNVSVLEPVSKPKLSSNTSVAVIGHNVTLSCHSRNGSLPINYTFFRQNITLSNQILHQQHTPAEITVHIKSTADTGEYKCKAVNGLALSKKRYSHGINLTIVDAIQGVNISSTQEDQSKGIYLLQCSVKKGSLPITFMWYKERGHVKQMLANATVNGTTSDYKVQVTGTERFTCEAQNLATRETSAVTEVQGTSASFTAMIVSLVVVLLLIVIALALVLALLILPKCKACFVVACLRANPENYRPESVRMSEPCKMVDAVDLVYDAPSEVEYTTLLFKDDKKVATKKDTSVEYADILIKNNN